MERLTLRQPPDTYPRDEYDAPIKRACSAGVTTGCINVDFPGTVLSFRRNPARYTDWTIYARRNDRGGREGIFADTMAGNWTTRFDTTRFAAIDSLDENWSIIDVDGREWDIEAVVAGPHGGGRLTWQIYAIRRKASK